MLIWSWTIFFYFTNSKALSRNIFQNCFSKIVLQNKNRKLNYVFLRFKNMSGCCWLSKLYQVPVTHESTTPAFSSSSSFFFFPCRFLLSLLLLIPRFAHLPKHPLAFFFPMLVFFFRRRRWLGVIGYCWVSSEMTRIWKKLLGYKLSMKI